MNIINAIERLLIKMKIARSLQVKMIDGDILLKIMKKEVQAK